MAREEERRRIRQDLHDGLGPTLTGVALSADAAANLLDSEPATVRELLRALRRDTRDRHRRRTPPGRRPAPAGPRRARACSRRCGSAPTSWPGARTAPRSTCELVMPEVLPALPAAVEVAAYRIATEALTNVARHAGARGAVLSCAATATLDLEVLDDGRAGSAVVPASASAACANARPRSAAPSRPGRPRRRPGLRLDPAGRRMNTDPRRRRRRPPDRAGRTDRAAVVPARHRGRGRGRRGAKRSARWSRAGPTSPCWT